MVTKGIVKSINRAGNRCVVRLPLFETASSSTPIEIEALINITPGMFNNLYVKDVVFVAFEENALEKPIVIGKLFKGTTYENETPGGAGILDSLNVRTSARIPCSTLYVFPDTIKNAYKNLDTPKKQADYLLWAEKFFKKLIKQLDDHFRCFKNWTQWQLRPENVEIDDGDLDAKGYKETESLLYQAENGNCQICGSKCSKNQTRLYSNLGTDKEYPEF